MKWKTIVFFLLVAFDRPLIDRPAIYLITFFTLKIVKVHNVPLLTKKINLHSYTSGCRGSPMLIDRPPQPTSYVRSFNCSKSPFIALVVGTPKKLLNRNKAKKLARHISVVLSAPTFLRPRVWIPSTPSTLFSFFIIEIVMWKGWKKQKEAGIGPF